jgi:flagellar basal-body rod modification protein FlgD
MADTKTVTGSVKDLMRSAATKPGDRSIKRELDKDAFLQLLVTQLKHQDPMKPMDDTNFIAQMAQFSSLEQMQNINKTLESQQQFSALTSASSLIGKQVSVTVPGEKAETVKGIVDEVRSIDGKVTVVVGGKAYDSALVTDVSEAKAEAPAAASKSAETKKEG